MNEKVTEARFKLGLAQQNYRRALAAVDGLLRAAVSQDPRNVADAKAVQDSYGNHGFTGATLAERLQPYAPPSAEPASETPVAVAEVPVITMNAPSDTPEAEHKQRRQRQKGDTA